jgi:hypothetical protein
VPDAGKPRFTRNVTPLRDSAGTIISLMSCSIFREQLIVIQLSEVLPIKTVANAIGHYHESCLLQECYAV